MQHHRCLAFATLLIAGPTVAQTETIQIGPTRSGTLLAERIGSQVQIRCTLPGFAVPPTQPWAGGAAYDPILDAVWISDGTSLAAVDHATCSLVCGPMSWPLPQPGAVIVGLEVVESLGEVWILDSAGDLHRARHGCPPLLLSTCSTGLRQTAGRACGGLAVDEVQGFVFYTYSNWTTQSTQVFIAPISAPCLPMLPPLNMINCPTDPPLRAVTGLAVDGCAHHLFFTDGAVSVVMGYLISPFWWGAQPCGVRAILPGPNDPFIGLAVRSRAATSLGTACASTGCAPCPLVHRLANAPNFGNPAFALAIDGVPAGGFAWCLVGVYACSGPGLFLPPLCGPLTTGPLLGVLGPVFTGPGSGCNQVRFTVPVTRAVCGWPYSSQGAILCTSAGLPGTAMTNCLTWTVQSN